MLPSYPAAATTTTTGKQKHETNINHYLNATEKTSFDKAVRVFPPTPIIHCPATFSLLCVFSQPCSQFNLFDFLTLVFSRLRTFSLPPFLVSLFLSAVMAARLPVVCAAKYSDQSVTLTHKCTHASTVIHWSMHNDTLPFFHNFLPSRNGFWLTTYQVRTFLFM